jgi:hypothetical protein
MENDRFREKVVRQLRHPCPRDPILLASTPKRAPPEASHMMPEHGKCTRIGRHCVIVEVATEDLPQPFPLVGDYCGATILPLRFITCASRKRFR